MWTLVFLISLEKNEKKVHYEQRVLSKKRLKSMVVPMLQNTLDDSSLVEVPIGLSKLGCGKENTQI